MTFHKLLGFSKFQEFFSISYSRILSRQGEVLWAEIQFREAVENIQSSQWNISDLVGICIKNVVQFNV